MDKELLKLLGIFAGGVVIGGGTAYLITNKVVEEKYRKIADEEIRSVKDVFNAQKGSLDDFDLHRNDIALHPDWVAGSTTTVIEGDPEVFVEPTPEETRNYHHSAAAYSSAVNPHEPRGTHPSDETPMAMEPDNGEAWFSKRLKLIPDETTDIWKDRDTTSPYVISYTEYMEEMIDTYEKSTLLYYEGDNTLTDEGDIPVENVGLVVGEALQHFGVNSRDLDRVFVRNELSETDYEVVKQQGSYNHVILGNEEDRVEPRRKVSKMRPED